MSARLRAALAVAVSVCALAAPASARAYSRGVSFHGCSGCHGAGTQTIEVLTMPSTLMPGDRATVTIVVRGSGVAIGLYADATDGAVAAIAGGGVVRSGDGMTHDGPQPISGGQASVEFAWTAPGEPGSVRFEVSTIVTNGNGRSSGDGAADGFFDFVYGCEPHTYYRDFDGDGHGQASLPRVHCVGGPPEGYAELDDDCADSDERAFPGADDVCNQRDDDCDGMIDEGADPVMQYPDADGDGYYGVEERESGESFFGCGVAGWASERGDCAPMDPEVNPGAEDVCNLRDDDCDLDVDERVRPQCGQGWCRRNSFTCDIVDCEPGEPRAEACNFFDDDCDGAVDESSCPAGQICVDFECIADDGRLRDGGGGRGDGGGGGGDAGGCGCSTGGRGAPVSFLLVLLAIALAMRQRRR